VFKEIGHNISIEFIAPEDAVLPLVKNDAKHVNEHVSEHVSEPVLRTLLDNPRATNGDISAVTGLSRATVTRHLRRLKQDGLIERIGSDKTGYWHILK